MQKHKHNVCKWQKYVWTDINASLTNPAAVMNMLKAPLMSAGESSVIVSLYFVILFTQLWLTEPFQAACKMTMHHYEILAYSMTTCEEHLEKETKAIFQFETLGSVADASFPCPGSGVAIRLSDSWANSSANGWADSWQLGGINMSSSWLSLQSVTLAGAGNPTLLYWGVTAVELRAPDISLFDI